MNGWMAARFYSLGLTGDKIHKYARIIAISDMYHAMTSERLYKEKQSPFKVIEEIEQDQFSKLDPEIVRSFIRNLANFSIGTKVRLSNKKNAEIVFIDPEINRRGRWSGSRTAGKSFLCSTYQIYILKRLFPNR